MLLNFSNHPSSLWLERQVQEALNRFHKIQDLPFPSVSPHASEVEIIQIAEEYLRKILELKAIHPELAVHIMGEFTLTHRLVNELTKHDIPCYASTTERQVVEVVEDNMVKKQIVFNFVKFREYI